MGEGESKITLGNTLGGIGRLTQGFGGYIQNRGYAEFNAASAKAAELAAAEAPKVAAWETTKLRMKKRTILSSQRFAAAYAGVTMAGTPTDIQQMTEREILLDEEGIYREGQLTAMAETLNAKAYKKAEKASKRSGTMSLISGGIGAAAMFL
jgi:hypothetical protein